MIGKGRYDRVSVPRRGVSPRSSSCRPDHGRLLLQMGLEDIAAVATPGMSLLPQVTGLHAPLSNASTH